MDTSRHLPTRLGLTSNSRRGAAAARVVRRGRGIRKVYARLASMILATTHHVSCCAWS
jgi:predicted metal-dependent HD superfamily phosphohydrolase